MTTTTAYTWNHQGKQFTRKFSSNGAITDYEGDQFLRQYEAGSIGLFICENNLVMLLASENVLYTKTIE